MNVWLIKDGEHLPVQPGARKMRTWLLADELVRRGHEVTWWSSTHSHQRKTLLFDTDRDVAVAPGFRLKLLHAGSYRGNRSLRRMVHHARLAAKFRGAAGREPRPDAIVSAFPTIELAHEAVVHGRANGVPVVVDIRDPWPDTMVEHAPAVLRPLARLAFAPLDARARESFRGSDSLVACSAGFLDWGLSKAGMERRPRDRVFYLGSGGRRQAGAASPRLAELAGRLAGKVVACFVGSFGKVYELDLVCAAAERLAGERYDRLHFVVAGDGEQAGRVAAAARTLPNLEAPGWLAAEEADQLMALGQIGLAPIRQNAGCVPNKIFEYAAAGLPILSSLQGETEGILARHGAGITYAPGDLAGLLGGLRRLSEDEGLRRQLADRSVAMFDREFLATRIYAGYVDHVEALCGHPAH
jgi:glycosyltransferase involved in cell wall biosynthesis